jgi:hypothetical protein
LWDLKHPDDPDWTYEPNDTPETARYEDESVLRVPASTASPIILALGVALLFAGLISSLYVSIAGILIVLSGSIAWFRDVLPHEKEQLVPASPTVAVSTNRAEIAPIHAITGHLHRARLPMEIHPVTAGARGGITGAAALAVLSTLWSTLTHHGLWYGINVAAASFFPERVTTAQLMAFHWDALMAGMAILVFGSMFVGLLYAALLPMVPLHPIAVAAIAMPLIGWALADSILATVNPVCRERIDWPWFIVSLAVFGIIAGAVVSRAERVRVWQHASLVERLGLKVDRESDSDGGASD